MLCDFGLRMVLMWILLQAQRDADEEGDYMAFEQLMAEATAKREKKDDKKKEKSHRHHMFGSTGSEKAEEKTTT